MHCNINIKLITPKAGYKKEIRFIKPTWDMGIAIKMIKITDLLYDILNIS
jgi:hypothetical protein